MNLNKTTAKLQKKRRREKKILYRFIASRMQVYCIRCKKYCKLYKGCNNGNEKCRFHREIGIFFISFAWRDSRRCKN